MTSAELSDWLRAHQAVLTAKPDAPHYEQINVEITRGGQRESGVAWDLLTAAEHAIRQFKPEGSST